MIEVKIGSSGSSVAIGFPRPLRPAPRPCSRNPKRTRSGRMRDSRDTSAMEFPCEFPIKVMGYWAEDFDVLVTQIVRRHVADLGEGAVRSRESRGGRFISITVTIEARSRDQLDAIYRDLTSETRVVMVL